MEQCVCFYIGWLDNCVCARQNQWERVWLENHNSLTPSFRSSRYTQLLYLNHLHHHTHTHTHTDCSEAASKRGRKQGKWKRGEQERGLLGAQSIELSRDSTLFADVLTDRGEAVTSGGERKAGAHRRAHTHACDTRIRCVS